MRNYKTYLKQLALSKYIMKSEEIDDRSDKLNNIDLPLSKTNNIELVNRDKFFETIKKVYGKPLGLNKDFDFRLDNSNPLYKNLILFSSFIILPDLYRLHITKISNNDSDLLRFLLNSAPRSLDLFSFCFDDGDQ